MPPVPRAFARRCSAGPPPEDGCDDSPPEDGCEDWPPEDGCEDWPPEDGCEDWPPEDGCEDWPPEDGCDDWPPEDVDGIWTPGRADRAARPRSAAGGVAVRLTSVLLLGKRAEWVPDFGVLAQVASVSGSTKPNRFR